MEPADQAFTASLFKWDPRGLVLSSSAPAVVQVPQPPPAMRQQWEQLGGLEEMFSLYGIRYFTAAKIAELGFTARTLVNMTDQELDDMMTSISHLFRWDLLVGERYGIKAAVRAERRRLLLHDPEQPEHQDSLFLLRRRSSDTITNMNNNNNFDALSHSQEGFSEEAVQQEKESRGVMRKKHRRSSKGSHRKSVEDEEEEEEEDEEEPRGAIISHNKIIMGSERQREHPFIVTEPGEVPRGKKNGLDYLFSLYDQCRDFLIQVQNIAKERGDKCPTKVTNEVFRYAKKAGAAHINKPKMRHYVHCYALHCLDQQASDDLRRSFKDRGENVGAWRLACYAPLVSIAARQAHSDIDSVFGAHPLLSIWYVPTRLRHLCHAHRHATAAPVPSHHHHPHLPF